MPNSMPPKLIRVKSEDQHFQRVEVLKRNRQKRRRYGAFFVEGVRAINLALAHDWNIEAFVYSSSQPLSQWAQGILSRSRADTHLDMPAALVEKLSDKEETSELLAVVKMREDDPSRIRVHPDMLVVVADRPASPGNLGSLIRSCDAFGVDGLIVTGHATDLYDPHTIRATVGSFFALPTILLPSHGQVLAWVRHVREVVPSLALIGTSANGRATLRAFGFSRAVVLLIGNETDGLSHAYKEASDHLITIPMRGSATSLNMAAAASVVLYEIDSQRNYGPASS
jgi:23S rRNA (uridine2479-2'-O)-methyltransferase